ncbi:DUF6087 family protein [Streptantibioticus ferralitis]|uniref:DUF6087 family protein n=1 Tax=Streptantibioticus ferralitis TaxID=236510 RepID=A0ABT5Z8M5_9ACTN|nr:DUF6087 family protein [Streptantibioticus ferralitis]MDF2260068.1 DUF6087 family protein [Streptantibioticus ferralitis]
MHEEEPLDAYLARHDAKIGRLQAVHAYGPLRGQHVDPDQPRLIQRWNGTAWEFAALAADLKEAQKILHPPKNEPAGLEPAEPAFRPMAPGRGRHRKA